uniref:E3 ubiquitin-protein ligase UHRF1-like n=1 Tax=Styela clava TaxID=7725 RepID=UPI00193934FD|nr:E3 ubiquitin-protein ligase UHRF1-like [Styela clava]
MWIQVRTFDGKKSIKIDGLSKLTKIEDIRGKIKEKFEVEEDKQRLFFNGKQLVDGHTLFDYSICLNNIIQLLERVTPPVLIKAELEDKNATEKDNEKLEENVKNCDSDSGVDIEGKKVIGDKMLPSIGQYKIFERVDAQDKNMGAWFEAVVMKVEMKSKSEQPEILENKCINSDDFCKPVIVQKQTSMENFVSVKSNDNVASDENKENVAPAFDDCKPSSSNTETVINGTNEADLLYHVKFEQYDEIEIVSNGMIRPRARKLLEWSEFDIGDVVMANYNIDNPKERGFWYDCIVIEKKERRKYKNLKVQILLASDKTLQPCKIVFVEEIFQIEEPGSLENRVEDEQEVPVKRHTMTDPECSHCNDKPNCKCKECGCHVCGEKKDFDKTLLCDECNLPFHTFCLNPPLENLPDVDDWYCPLCRNDKSEVVMAGERLKESKKKSKMKSATSTTQRDWGKGMACVGRSKVCTIVPSNHFGPIPGIPVGSLWKFRVQVSEAGVHRPHVSGIHGKGTDACYSIVLAGGYEDDEDNGEEFTYTGSGGRDLSGNKRTAEQSCDQVLTKSNLSIARSCDAKLDSIKGNVAKDWKKGSPIRVVRNYKGAKHSEYAPEDGNRYDGIYKVVKYWPEKGKSGFIVWRYLFRRDDSEPAPWTKEGKKKAKNLGLVLQYPDGYLESQATKEDDKKSKKRKRESEVGAGGSPNKKSKIIAYKITADVKEFIKLDEANSKLWDEVKECAEEGQINFFQKLEEVFTCICCQDVVYKPITSECKHNICKSCLKRSFNAEVYSCPTCRFELGKNYKFVVNENLQNALLKLLPGYDNGR